jgi:hypothetical protein
LTNIRSASLLPDATIDENVNDFTAELWDAYDWPQAIASTTLTFTSATAVSMPSNTRRVLAVRGADGRNLRQIGERELAFLEQSTGKPTLYFPDMAGAVTVRVFPTPQAAEALTVTYRTGPPTVAAGNDVLPFEAEYHMAWCYFAAAAVLGERAGNEQKAADYASRVARLVGRMRRRYLHGSSWEITEMPVDRWQTR